MSLHASIAIAVERFLETIEMNVVFVSRAAYVHTLTQIFRFHIWTCRFTFSFRWMTACDRRTDLANQTNVMSTDDRMEMISGTFFGKSLFLFRLLWYGGKYRRITLNPKLVRIFSSDHN